MIRCINNILALWVVAFGLTLQSILICVILIPAAAVLTPGIFAETPAKALERVAAGSAVREKWKLYLINRFWM